MAKSILTVTVKAEVASWWKDIRLPLLQLKGELGLPIDLGHEALELMQAVSFRVI